MSASTTFRLEINPTFRELNGRFVAANRQLLEDRRDEVRLLGSQMVNYLQEEAPKLTGEFARNIRYRTFQQGDKVGFTTSSPQPLGRWIVGGTKAHEIRPRGQGYPLHWVKGGQHFYAYRVWHPGTKPNDYVGRARDRWQPDARQALARISLRYSARVTGR